MRTARFERRFRLRLGLASKARTSGGCTLVPTNEASQALGEAGARTFGFKSLIRYRSDGNARLPRWQYDCLKVTGPRVQRGPFFIGVSIAVACTNYTSRKRVYDCFGNMRGHSEFP